MSAIIEFDPPRVSDPEWAIERVLTAPVAAMGLEIVTVECGGSKNRPIVRVFIDRPGEGVTLDDCSQMTPVISNALDAAEADPADAAELGSTLLKGYTLEVSSPGIDRPLAKRTHFDAVVGRRVFVETHAPLHPELDERQKRFHGFVVETEVDPGFPDDPRAGGVRLRELDSERDLWIPLPRIRRANLVHQD